MFTDPFIYHAIQACLSPVKDPYDNQILLLLKNPYVPRLVRDIGILLFTGLIEKLLKHGVTLVSPTEGDVAIEHSAI